MHMALDKGQEHLVDMEKAGKGQGRAACMARDKAAGKGQDMEADKEEDKVADKDRGTEAGKGCKSGRWDAKDTIATLALL